MSRAIKKLIISSGEPAGIGPEQIIKLAQFDYDFEWVVLADPTLLKQTAEQLNLPITITTYQQNHPTVKNARGMLKVIPISLAENAIAGQLNVNNAHYVLEILNTAVKLCMKGEFDGLVTAPIHKGIINEAGIKFTLNDAVKDLKKAFEKKLLIKPLDNEYYFNIKRMKNLQLK